MRKLGLSTIQCDWCSSKMRLRLGHTQGEDCVKTQGEGGHLPAKQKVSGEASPADTFVLDFQPPNCEEINFCWLSHSGCGHSDCPGGKLWHHIDLDFLLVFPLELAQAATSRW